MSVFLAYVLLMLGGFLVGGAYAMRKTNRVLSIALLLLAILSAASGVLRLV